MTVHVLYIMLVYRL